MTLKERIAYIKGLAEGLNLNEDKAEVKIINEMLNMLEDVAYAVTGLEEQCDELSFQLDTVDEDLADVEEELFGDGCCGFDEEENPEYEVKCPECGFELTVDEDTLLEGEISCPNCGDTIEFDFSSLFGEDGCACGNPDCKGCNE